MAKTFKSLLGDDTVNTRTMLHEAIPITGTISSGTYDDNNVKTFSHGMFDSVYDYPYLSSSANHIFDITVGYSTGSYLSGNVKEVARTMQEDKISIYNQMAQVLMGHDVNGAIKGFTWGPNGREMNSCFFLNFIFLLGLALHRRE